MSWQDYLNNSLWPIMVETVHSMVMYSRHKAYVQNEVLAEKPDITAKELALKLGISFGESLVILYELQKPRVEP